MKLFNVVDTSIATSAWGRQGKQDSSGSPPATYMLETKHDHILEFVQYLPHVDSSRVKSAYSERK